MKNKRLHHRAILLLLLLLVLSFAIGLRITRLNGSYLGNILDPIDKRALLR